MYYVFKVILFFCEFKVYNPDLQYVSFGIEL
ncbi:MAG: hypothetical protein JWQ28_2537, partial [Pedobacter sp.]|nr:hypothetical protein [Pedobacter sp.]